MPRSVGSPVGRTYPVRELPVKRWELGPWSGVVRAVGSRPDLKTLYSAYNAMLFPPGSGAMTRPGLDRLATGTQLGSGSTRQAQLVFQYNKSDGTYNTMAICGGKVYRYNWATDTWTEYISAGTFSGASITLSTTARCFACNCGNKMVVTDGVNTPWMWDGTLNGGLTKLTNAPVFYGAPVVYGAKVFAIKNTERDTIVWSEENDPTIGYEAGGYNDSWTLSQTGSENLVALASTNEALYFFRRNEVGAIFGAVNPDFQTSATRDSVSTVIGAGAVGAVAVYDRWVWFLDMRGRLHRFAPGGSIEPIWQQHAADVGVWEDKTGLGLSGGAYPINETVVAKATDLVPLAPYNLMLAYSSADANLRAYDTATGAYQGYWTMWTSGQINLMGAVYDDNSDAYTTMAVSINPGTPSAAGITSVFHEIQNTSAATSGKDTANVYGVQIVTQPVGLNEALNWRFTRAVLRYQSALQSDTVGWFQAVVPTMRATSSTTEPNAQQITFKARRSASLLYEGTIEIGINQVGREAHAAVLCTTLDSGWVRITGLTVEAVPLDQNTEPY